MIEEFSPADERGRNPRRHRADQGGLGADGMKDMGRVMGELKGATVHPYMSRASGLVKESL